MGADENPGGARKMAAQLIEEAFKRTVPCPKARAFFEGLERELALHPALHHRFLRRFSEADLTREHLAPFAVQHYLYSRFFIRNMAAVIANVPDENARSLLILNIYEEIGEPLRIRDRVHFLLLEAGLVTPDDVGAACMQVVT